MIMNSFGTLFLNDYCALLKFFRKNQKRRKISSQVCINNLFSILRDATRFSNNATMTLVLGFIVTFFCMSVNGSFSFSR